MYYRNIISVLAATVVFADSAHKTAERQVWRIVPSSAEEIQKLRDIGVIFELDFWKGPTTIGRAVDFLVTGEKRAEVTAALERNGLTAVEAYIHDVDKLIAQQFKPTPRSAARTVADFDYSNYHTAEEIYGWMDLAVQEYGGFVTKKQIGVTYNGNPIYALEFRKGTSSPPKPKIFVDALIHCREWITTASLMYIFKEMLQNTDYSHMLDEADWYFIPMINIDGYIKTWEEDRLWRKTVHPGASSACDGVDANRNFDAKWSMPGASPHPCSFSYYGPTPASESEVRNLASYVLGFGRGNISAYLTVHSYSQLILYPYGFTAEEIPEYDFVDETAKRMHDAIKAVHGKEYIYGPSSTTIYVTSGTTQDWAYDEAGVTLTYTYELRDTGNYGFILPADQIMPQGEEFLAGMEELKKVVLENWQS